ncbi:MAG: carbon-nitrogen hydrolase family protein [Bacteroidota bacterium]
MRICLAQIASDKGAVTNNIQHHLKVIAEANALQVDLIIFPELSITAYEPILAEALALDWHDTIFDPFQKIADENNTSIGIGMPTKANNGINISMLIFQPQRSKSIYSKRILHADELPYFVSGEHQPFLNIKGKKIALGICYETLQRSHFVNAVENEADIYIASVAKPARGTDKAYLHFPSVAKAFQLPILMCNCVGYCDNFLSDGKSAIWNRKGQLLQQLGEQHQGLLVYDTELETVEARYLLFG